MIPALWLARVEVGSYLALDIKAPLPIVVSALGAALTRLEPDFDAELMHYLKVEVRPL